MFVNVLKVYCLEMLGYLPRFASFEVFSPGYGIQ
jgi:hypothetical protein